MIFKELSKDEYGKLLGIFMCNTEEHPNSELVKSGRFLKPHADNHKNVNQGNIAIGYGFDLKVNDTAQITKLYRGVFGDKWQLTQEESLVLKDYKKAIIFISHDVYFLDNVVNRVFEIEGKRLKDYKGNYTDFLIQKEAYLSGEVKAYEKEQDKIKKMEEFEENRSDGHDYKGSEPTYVAPFLCNTYFRSGCRPSNRAGITWAFGY